MDWCPLPSEVLCGRWTCTFTPAATLCTLTPAATLLSFVAPPERRGEVLAMGQPGVRGGCTEGELQRRVLLLLRLHSLLLAIKNRPARPPPRSRTSRSNGRGARPPGGRGHSLPPLIGQPLIGPPFRPMRRRGGARISRERRRAGRWNHVAGGRGAAPAAGGEWGRGTAGGRAGKASVLSAAGRPAPPRRPVRGVEGAGRLPSAPAVWTRAQWGRGAEGRRAGPSSAARPPGRGGWGWLGGASNRRRRGWTAALLFRTVAVKNKVSERTAGVYEAFCDAHCRQELRMVVLCEELMKS